LSRRRPPSTEPDTGKGAGVTGEPREEKGLSMEPEEMRRLGYAAVDLLVRRWEELPGAPAWIGGSRADLEPGLSESAPARGRDPDEVLERAAREILERAGRVDHPRFFAFVPSSPTWPSVLADFLSSGFNVFQGTWLESAGPSQAELVVLDWFREWLGLPEGASGLFTSGGSAANLVALVAARERAGNPARGVVYLGEQGHSSLERGARIAGFGAERVRKIGADARFRMDPAELLGAIREDREAGCTPVCVCASAGTTNTGAIDPLEELAELCREEDVWFHVDGAYGGFAVLVPEVRGDFRGIERADSVTLDPHKWLFQTFEAGCLVVREPAHLEAAFRILPEYLQDTDMGLEQVNFGDRGVQLTRSFRALKVWMSVQMLGVEAFRDGIAGGIDLAARAAGYIRDSASLELVSDAALGIVCFRYRPAPGGDAREVDELNASIQDRVVESGFAMMSSTRLGGRFALRLCILGHRTAWEDVASTLALVERTGTELESENAGAT
jgi:aromatic-L-amino-acid/L-tryptophan decarboxylase